MTTASRFPEEIEHPDSAQPLTAEEVRHLRGRLRTVSVGRVIGLQVLGGVLASLAAWAVTGRFVVAVSAAYGACAVALPAAVFARGLTGRLWSLSPEASAAGFIVWQMVKLGLTLALLLLAPRLVSGLSWPALLVGLVVAIKVYWLALAWGPRR